MRIRVRRRLFLDDAFLAFALACLCGITGILWPIARIASMVKSSEGKPVTQTSLGNVSELLKMLNIFSAFNPLAWTTIFFVKFSFLSLFRLLIRNVSKYLTRFYWVIVGITVASWIYCICGNLIFCHSFALSLSESINLRVKGKANLNCSKMPKTIGFTHEFICTGNVKFRKCARYNQ